VTAVRSAAAAHEQLRKAFHEVYLQACKAAADSGPLTKDVETADQSADAGRYREAAEKLRSLDALCRKTVQEARTAFETASREADPSYQTALVVAAKEDRSDLTSLHDRARTHAAGYEFPEAVSAV